MIQATQIQDDLNYVNKVLAEMSKESDRSAAVMIGAEIDNSVVRLLENYLLPSVKKSPRFIEQEGALGTFSARIEAVYRLGLIPPSFHHDLHIMRSIRNDFAHGRTGLSFQSDRIKDLCNNLIIAEDFRREQMADTKINRPENFMRDPKSRFMMTSSTLLAHLTLLKFQIGKTQEHWKRFFSPMPPKGGQNEPSKPPEAAPDMPAKPPQP